MKSFRPMIWGMAPEEQQVPLRLPLLGQQLSTIMTHQLAKLDQASAAGYRPTARALLTYAKHRSA